MKCTARAGDLRKYDERINNLNGHIVADIGSDKLAQVCAIHSSYSMVLHIMCADILRVA